MGRRPDARYRRRRFFIDAEPKGAASTYKWPSQWGRVTPTARVREWRPGLGIVRPLIVTALDGIQELDAIIYEPTATYQNVAKWKGVEKLTPSRALVAEMVRRYRLLGIDCSILEVQKLAWLLERGLRRLQVEDPLKFSFSANKFRPYSHYPHHLLDSLDGGACGVTSD